jgi:hypothetical protein
MTSEDSKSKDIEGRSSGGVVTNSEWEAEGRGLAGTSPRRKGFTLCLHSKSEGRIQ